MYIITKKSPTFPDLDLFYQFSNDETDLYCVATDTLDTCQKYNDADKKRLETSKLLASKGVKFKKLSLSF